MCEPGNLRRRRSPSKRARLFCSPTAAPTTLSSRFFLSSSSYNQNACFCQQPGATEPRQGQYRPSIPLPPPLPELPQLLPPPPTPLLPNAFTNLHHCYFPFCHYGYYYYHLNPHHHHHYCYYNH
ncbi:unnamed protein product [Mesocestoides corti]|uniref:Uncharacterized protein n=1 Tax=Mesocestoides corti TaxID=53468 RepID=A0A0R3URA0_MESCO|nr:unnamed protein product [Mesocestoides corti]